MNQNGVLALYDYNAYANDLVFKTAAQLTESKFTQVSSPSHSSVSELLTHMLESEAFFLSVCTGNPVEELPSHMTPTTIYHFCKNLTKETHNYLIKLTDSDLMKEIDVPINGQLIRLFKWQALIQGFVHSTHHRGELSIALTELGYPLPTLDIIIRFAEQSNQEWPLKRA